DVRAEIIAACAQLARGELLIGDIVKKQGLHGINIAAAPRVELVLNDVEQAAMQTLDKRQGFKVAGPDLGMPGGAGRLRGLGFGRIHHKSNLISLTSSFAMLRQSIWRVGRIYALKMKKQHAESQVYLIR